MTTIEPSYLVNTFRLSYINVQAFPKYSELIEVVMEFPQHRKSRL